MITEARYKEICREEGATKKAAQEYWEFEQKFNSLAPGINTNDETPARRTNRNNKEGGNQIESKNH